MLLILAAVTKISFMSPDLPVHHDDADEAARIVHIRTALADEYPDADCELDFTTPLELLIATVLSAQCTDARVNQVTRSFLLGILPHRITRPRTVLTSSASSARSDSSARRPATC